MITVQRQVQASPQRVWDVLTDGWAYASWVVGTARIRSVDDRWPAAGSRIHHSFGLWPALIDDSTSALEVDAPHRLVLQARGWPLGEARIELALEPRDGGTLVTMREDATDGPGRLVPAPVRHAMLHPRNVESLRRLALMAENRPGAS